MAIIKKKFTAEQYRDSLLYDIYNLKTAYSNRVDQSTKTFYNCGYRGMNAYYFDCWNWHKVKAWGWVPGYNVGSFLYAPGTNGVDDWNGRQILNHCENVSSDFKNTICSEFLLTAAEDHAGVFIDEEKWNGYIFNVAECTPKIVRNGVLVMSDGCHLSYVDEQGRRYNHKGGVQVGAWAKHGRLPWVDYNSGQKFTYDIKKDAGKLIIDFSGTGSAEITLNATVK